MRSLKEGDEILDLTELKRRGILGDEDSEPKPPRETAGYFDFTSKNTESSSPSPNPLSFLDDIAKANTPSTASTIASASDQTDSVELQGLRNKIDDLEYKIDRLMEKVAKLEG